MGDEGALIDGVGPNGKGHRNRTSVGESDGGSRQCVVEVDEGDQTRCAERVDHRSQSSIDIIEPSLVARTSERPLRDSPRSRISRRSNFRSARTCWATRKDRSSAVESLREQVRHTLIDDLRFDGPPSLERKIDEAGRVEKS